MTAVLRYLAILSILVVCSSRFCHCKSFYIDYEEDVAIPEVYTNSGTKVLDEAEPEGVSSQKGPTAKVRVHGEEFTPWAIYPIPTSDSGSWEMQARQRRDKGVKERTFDSRRVSTSPKLITKAYNSHNANQEGLMKRQSILYSQCFFNPISCF